MKQCRLYNLIMTSLILFVTISGCKKADDAAALTSADNFIGGLSTLVDNLSTTQDIPVIFPRLIPKDDTHSQYYVNSEIFTKDGENVGYMVSIGYTENCNGVHACTVGYVRANKAATPELLQDSNNKDITVPVMLANDTQGYFTPGYAMGSYFPPMIQWQQQGVLYSISWDDKLVDRDALKAMANSSISSKD